MIKRLLVLPEGERTQVRPPPKNEIIFDLNNKARKISLHHRKPRSIGGNNSPANKVWLCCVRHDLWHRIFANFWPDEITEKINNSHFLKKDFVLECRLSGLNTPTTFAGRKESCYGTDEMVKHVSIIQHEAWGSLFGGLGAEEIVYLINRDFLDPDYEIYIS